MESQDTNNTAGEKTSKPAFFYGYVIVIASFIVVMMGWGVFSVYGVFFTPLIDEFGWSRAVTSAAYSISVVMSGVMGIVAGKLSDRWGPKKVIMFCAVILALGYVLMSLVQSVWQFYVLFGLVLATGICGSWSPPLVAISHWFASRRGLMTGIVTGGISIGTLIMAPVMTHLISIYGWRISYVIIGIAVLIIMMIAAQFLKPSPSEIQCRKTKFHFTHSDSSQNPEKEVEKGRMDSVPVSQYPTGLQWNGQEGEIDSKKFHRLRTDDIIKPEPSVPGLSKSMSLGEAVRVRQFWLACLIYLCFGVSLFTVMVHIVPNAIDFGISPINAAAILSIMGITGMLGRLVFGTMTDRLRAKRSIVIGLILLTISLFWLQQADNLWKLCAFAIFFGFSYGGISCIQSLLAVELFGLTSLGVITAILSFSVNLGGAAGPVLAGYIFDVSGSYKWGFLICLILTAIALIISFFLKPLKK